MSAPVAWVFRVFGHGDNPITNMALPVTPRLDNLKAMQTRPLGTNTALYRDPTTEGLTRQYNQQRSDYNMARRLLRRQARRGNVEAAMNLIDLGNDAEKRNVSFGMQGQDQRGAEIASKRRRLEQKTREQEAANSRLVPQTPRLDAMGDSAATPTVGEPPSMLKRPEDSTDLSLGTKALPQTGLGARSEQAMREMGGNTTGFRQGLDRAIGMAKTPQEMAELQDVAKQSGISEGAFKRRSEWWNKKRNTYA